MSTNTKYPKFMLTGVIAEKGDYSLPQEEKPSNGRFSISKGFDVENSLPLDQGGVPPFRQDFNGMAYLLSQFLVWYQQGGVMGYSASFDYEEGNEINHKGKKWRCVKANGKSTKLVEPSTNPTYWREASASHIAGEVVAFANVRLGGSDGRRPIFWGEASASEGWVLCDGGSDGRGGSVPNLIGKCIQGGTPSNAGAESGGVTFSSSGIPVGAVVQMAGRLDDPNNEFLKLGNSFELSKSDYPDLSRLLGDTWGTPSSTSKFKTPDLAGRYTRSAGDSAGAEGKLGYLQEAGVPEISGSFANTLQSIELTTATGAFSFADEPFSKGAVGEDRLETFMVDFLASQSNPIYGASDSVTPRTAVLDSYVKAKPSTPSGANGKTAKLFTIAYFVKLPN